MRMDDDDDNFGERRIDALIPLLIQLLPITAFFILGNVIWPTIRLPLAIVLVCAILAITTPPEDF